MFEDSKHLTKWIIASTSLICARNLFPKPSPLEAPLTRPAISTNVILALTFFFELDSLYKTSSLWSGTSTIPILGSIVQKGKLAACAFFEEVKALNNVDFPTLGSPTIPHLNPIQIFVYLTRKNINFILNNTSAGGTSINDTILHYMHLNLPFGGINNSGFGRTHGEAGFKASSNQRSILKQSRLSPMKLLYPPYNNSVKKMIKFLMKYI